MPAKKITKFKSKKGGTGGGAKSSLGGGAKNVKKALKSGSTAHALPSQAQVLHQQQQAAVPKAAQPPPAPKAAPPAPKAAPPMAPPPPSAKKTVPPVTPGRPSQSQTMSSPSPASYVGAPPPGGRTGAVPINTAIPAPGGLKGRTLPGSVPGIMKTKTQSSSIEDLPFDKQLEIKTEELTDQVINMLEVADSLLDPDWTPDDIIDIVHVLVRSVNLDVVTMVLPAINYPEQLDVVLSRGYELSPRKPIVDLWLKTFDDKAGIDWKKLMKLAEDNKSDLAYWIVSEELNSIGYVPVRDGNYIYGFLFVASIGKKEPSPLTASLLDLCGSHLGLAYALKLAHGG